MFLWGFFFFGGGGNLGGFPLLFPHCVVLDETFALSGPQFPHWLLHTSCGSCCVSAFHHLSQEVSALLSPFFKLTLPVPEVAGARGMCLAHGPDQAQGGGGGDGECHAGLSPRPMLTGYLCFPMRLLKRPQKQIAPGSLGDLWHSCGPGLSSLPVLFYFYILDVSI